MCFRNGMVAVFDTNGQQVPELQGPIEEVRANIEACADESTVFENWPDRSHGSTSDGA